jgi:hypothetical protein
MKPFKITVLALCMLTVNVAWAQNTPPTPEQIATEKNEQFAKQYKLTEQQKKETYQAYLQNAQQISVTRAKYGKDVTAIRQADQENNKILSESLNKILTEKQKAELEKPKQTQKLTPKQVDNRKSTTDTK